MRGGRWRWVGLSVLSLLISGNRSTITVMIPQGLSFLMLDGFGTTGTATVRVSGL